MKIKFPLPVERKLRDLIDSFEKRLSRRIQPKTDRASFNVHGVYISNARMNEFNAVRKEGLERERKKWEYSMHLRRA